MFVICHSSVQLSYLYLQQPQKSCCRSRIFLLCLCLSCFFWLPYFIDLPVETSAAWFRLAHWISHLCTTMGKLPVIFIVFLTPTRRRDRTATATWLRHGSGCINVPCKQQYRYMSDILCCRYIIVLWNLNLISKDIFDWVRKFTLYLDTLTPT